MKNLLSSLLFLFFSNTVYCTPEVVHYDILLWGNKIGSLTATRDVRPDGTELYTLDTKSEAKIFWMDKENQTHYVVVYKDGKLVSSVFTETEKGERKRWNNISWDGTKYNVDGYKGKRTFTEPPTYSVVLVYFKDIKNVSKIFYETEGDYNTLEHPEADTWQFKSTDGHVNTYHFLNGRLETMEFKVSIATVKMARSR